MGNQLIYPVVENRALLISDGSKPSLTHPELDVVTQLPTTSISTTATSNVAPLPCSVRCFQFSKNSLDKLKQKCSESLSDSWISTNDALCALLWQRITLARKLNKDEDTKFGMACNGRDRIQPPLPKGYFGNSNFFVYSDSKIEDLLNLTLSEVALKVRKAVNEVNDEKIRSSINFVHSFDDSSKLRASFIGPADVAFTCWNKFPMMKPTFGNDTPYFVGIPPVPFYGLGIVLDTPKQDGSVNVLLGLTKEQMDTFLEDEIFTLYTE